MAASDALCDAFEMPGKAIYKMQESARQPRAPDPAVLQTPGGEGLGCIPLPKNLNPLSAFQSRVNLFAAQ